MDRQHNAPTRAALLSSTSHADAGASLEEARALSSGAEPVVAMPADGFLTPAKLAHLLGVSIRTLQRWDAARIGPPRCKIGNLILYTAASVRGWLDAAERSPLRREPVGRRFR